MTRQIFHGALARVLLPGMVFHALTAFGSGGSELEAFPAAGKDMMTDGVNRYRLGITIEPRTLQGWGYTYYEVVGKGETIGTLMAPPEGAPMVSEFVTAAPLLVRYNSRLLIVVYAPSGYEVRYRIWQASNTFEDAGRR